MNLELQLFSLEAKRVSLIDAGSLVTVPWTDVYVALSAQAQTLSGDSVRGELDPIGIELLQAQSASYDRQSHRRSALPTKHSFRCGALSGGGLQATVCTSKPTGPRRHCMPWEAGHQVQVGNENLPK